MDLERKHVVAKNGCTFRLSLSDLGVMYLIQYFMINSFFLKFEFCIPYAAFVQNSSHVSGENVRTFGYRCILKSQHQTLHKSLDELKFGKMQPHTTELAALKRLKN